MWGFGSSHLSRSLAVTAPVAGAGLLVLGSLDDMVFEPGATLCQQTIGEHFTWPLDWQVGGEYPDIRRGPDRAMLFRQLRVEQIRPHRHIDAVPALCM